MRHTRRDVLRLGAAAALPALAQRPARPNIVFILADDLGYGDLSCLNPESKIRTPHLDRMAAEGAIFTDAHSPSAVCTPTRYGIVTGRYAWRSRLKRGVLQGGSPPLIEPDRPTVASVLKAQGYATACVGKWHLGLGWASADGEPVVDLADNADFRKPFTGGPTALGFDYYYGISASLDMPPYTFLENDRVAELPTTRSEGEPFPRNWRPGPAAPGFRHQQVLHRLTEKATAWLGRQKPGRPYFLYLPLSAPHTPVVPREEFKGRTGAGDYGAFVAEVDWTVAQVLDALRRNGTAENTLVIFTSDNGPERQMVQRKTEFGHASAWHFRGHKRHLWDGGHRIPFLARWPGRVKPGTKSGELVCLTDLMATSAALSGARLPAGAGPDSCDISPALLGKPTRPPREAVVHHSANGAFSIRQGEWKLLLLRGNGDLPEAKDTRLPPGQLYNVVRDPGEERNVYGEHPEIVARLTALLEKVRAGD